MKKMERLFYLNCLQRTANTLQKLNLQTFQASFVTESLGAINFIHIKQTVS